MTAYRPIAVSIECKRAYPASDPLMQLIVWTAAWQKRMRALRWEMSLTHVGTVLNDETAGTSTNTASPETRLVTVPLIQVVAHQWQMYFACDEGAFLVIYGPILLGSTYDISGLYSLISSLGSLKRWVEDEFYTGMKEWFMCT